MPAESFMHCSIAGVTFGGAVNGHDGAPAVQVIETQAFQKSAPKSVSVQRWRRPVEFLHPLAVGFLIPVEMHKDLVPSTLTEPFDQPVEVTLLLVGKPHLHS